MSSAFSPLQQSTSTGTPTGGNMDARPPSIETPTNRWFIHRIAAALLPPAIRLGIHPNTVSLMGLAFGAGAGFAYWQWRDPWMATLGFILMIGWHICDGLDGQLARATGKVTALGRLLDGVCDYATFIMVLLPIALSFDNWPLTLTLALASGVAHALQSAYYEGERESWIRRSRGIFTVRPRSNAGGFIERSYNKIESTLGNRERPVDAWLAANPQRLPQYLAATAPVMRTMAILSANSRTVAIWTACMIGLPVTYWLWELIGLSLFAMMLAGRLRQVETALETGDAAALSTGRRE
ncbi:CDP-alcohol phosphatidyltransferase family protein [Polymorphobacter arshaanensis]|uniref:CDP-alcohol phosphatidyltransferase family protein n=2 Tax=Glacieibacterium arshaanense TaxID=2511025 RepID=A0A4Y9ESA6_9SPHN|nr:CDP-alcohol phosphatidyltransferase family protein [Polymorphobacter arshaanensis]